MAPSVAIVIRTKDEERFIGETLEAVSSQSLTADEIIIVDSGSRDKTLQIASQFRAEIIRIPASQFTYGGALNTGFNRSKSSILVSLSADAKPAGSDWLSELIKHLKDPRVAGVYGRQIPRAGTSLSEKRDILERYREKVVVQSKEYFFSNVNAAIRKDVWERVRFSETMPCAEDWDWARRVQALDYLIVYEPGAAVFHSHNHSFMQVYRRAESVARGASALDPSLKVGFLNALVQIVRETLRDSKFVFKNRAVLNSLLCSPMYRLARSLGNYQGVRHGIKSAHRD